MSDISEDRSHPEELEEASADPVEDDAAEQPEVTVTAIEVTADEPGEDESVLMEDHTEHTNDDSIEDDEDDDTVRSINTEEASASKQSKETPSKSGGSGKEKAHRGGKPTGRKGRTPSVKGLTIPFRTVKKVMKLDPDTPIVQNEAAIMTTMAAELFLKRLAKQSYYNAKRRGRNTIRYEDIAEARTKTPALSFLEAFLP